MIFFVKCAEGALGVINRGGTDDDHLANAMRSAGIIKPRICLVGSMRIDDDNTIRFGSEVVEDGEILTIDGTTGLIFRGELPDGAFCDSEVIQVFNRELEPEYSFWWPYYRRAKRWIALKDAGKLPSDDFETEWDEEADEEEQDESGGKNIYLTSEICDQYGDSESRQSSGKIADVADLIKEGLPVAPGFFYTRVGW